jgi:hypothetical protein
MSEATSFFLVQSQEGLISHDYIVNSQHGFASDIGAHFDVLAIAKGCINDAELWCYGGRAHVEA